LWAKKPSISRRAGVVERQVAVVSTVVVTRQKKPLREIEEWPEVKVSKNNERKIVGVPGTPTPLNSPRLVYRAAIVVSGGDGGRGVT
jgi:hypothetical protein